VLDPLDEPAHRAVHELLETPWRLMLAITAIEDEVEAEAKAGRVKDALTVADRLALRPLSAPGAPPPAPPSRAEPEKMLLAAFIPAAPRRARPRGAGGGRRYQPDRVRRWLTYLARHLDWQARYTTEHRAPRGMSPVDIVPHLLWPIGGWHLPRLLHATATLVLFAAALAVLLPPARWRTVSISCGF